MTSSDFDAFVERYRAAWNSKDVARVLVCFTDDHTYTDAASRGAVVGKDALQRYVERFLAALDITYAVVEAHPFADRPGGAIVWGASVRRPGGDLTVEGRGVDLVYLREGLVERVESYYDRVPYAPLLQDRESR